jgi:hypothetical protein
MIDGYLSTTCHRRASIACAVDRMTGDGSGLCRSAMVARHSTGGLVTPMMDAGHERIARRPWERWKGYEAETDQAVFVSLTGRFSGGK